MAVYKTRDYTNPKSLENRLAVGLRIGLGLNGEATNAQVDEFLERTLKQLREERKRVLNDVAFDPSSPDA